MSIHPDLLDVLVCPVTKQKLQMLSDEQRAKLNEHIARGAVQNVGGTQVENPIEEGFVTVDAKTVYRVDDGIPIMLAEEGIGTEQIGGL